MKKRNLISTFVIFLIFSICFSETIAKEKSKSETDLKLDTYEQVTNKFCELKEQERNGKNVYLKIDEVTREFAELNQELSSMIEDGKLSKKQYNRFSKITDKFEECSNS